jgi:hypothetical protein
MDFPTGFPHGRVEVTGDDAKALIDRMSAAFDGDVASEITIDFKGRFLSLAAATTLRSYFVEKGARSPDSDVIVFPKSPVHVVHLIELTGFGLGMAEPIIPYTDFKMKLCEQYTKFH